MSTCDCCGSWVDDEPIVAAMPSPEEVRENRIIHEFRKRTDPAYRERTAILERMERAFIYGADALRGPVVPGIREVFG